MCVLKKCPAMQSDANACEPTRSDEDDDAAQVATFVTQAACIVITVRFLNFRPDQKGSQLTIISDWYNICCDLCIPKNVIGYLFIIVIWRT